jgi:hypothetical protein
MKITKFAALAGAALLATAGAYAQGTTDYGLPQGFSFSNEIGSDVAKVTGNAHKDYEDTNWRSEFAGIYDKIVISYASEKVTFNLEPKFGIKDFNENYYDAGTIDNSVFGHGQGFHAESLYGKGGPLGLSNRVDGNGSLNSDDLGWGYWDLGWGLKFTPFDIVSFYLHKGEDHRVSNADALLGRQGRVVETVFADGFGRVQIDGDVWKAVTNGSADIPAGTAVRVVNRESTIITVTSV